MTVDILHRFFIAGEMSKLLLFVAVVATNSCASASDAGLIPSIDKAHLDYGLVDCGNGNGCPSDRACVTGAQTLSQERIWSGDAVGLDYACTPDGIDPEKARETVTQTPQIML